MCSLGLTAEEGPLLGLREGDRLGLDVGYMYEMNCLKRLKLEHIMCRKSVNWYPQYDTNDQKLTAEGPVLGDDVGGSEGETV